MDILLTYRYYSLSFVAVGFSSSSLFGLADLYRTCYCSYSHNYLAAKKGIQTVLTICHLSQPVYLNRRYEPVLPRAGCPGEHKKIENKVWERTCCIPI